MIDSETIKSTVLNASESDEPNIAISDTGIICFPSDSDAIGHIYYSKAFKTFAFNFNETIGETVRCSGCSGTFAQVMGFIATYVVYGEVKN